MKKLVYIDEKQKNEVLGWAVAKAVPCVLARRAESGWRTVKTRIVAGSAADGSLILAAPEANGAGAKPSRPYQPGERVGLTFRRGHKKCMCAAVVRVPPETAADRGGTSCVIVLEWPDALQELQRRVYYRATPGRRIHVRFWPGGLAKRADASASEGGILFGTLLDLSAGGMRVLTTQAPDGRFVEGDPVGCAFAPKPRAEAIVLDATFRHQQPEADGACSLGFQFVGLETTETGRQTLADLARIVTEFQRGHSRPSSALANPAASR